ncbi:LRR receptor-like serine/threonine-protein kinase GSO1 [Morus notabilis]|uniref:LRR receptor-like serine/threonine-protein kinase GSO1 n=1 Tax=Morus notabilis TaxID=981085 RepID=W9S195_9ROSA|nr:receptor-like protein EIX2 [Morus notabilis]EXC07674.1 LRR receptor-like serine/threonine-protein kinase GSO1 [Morus notabilis]
MGKSTTAFVKFLLLALTVLHGTLSLETIKPVSYLGHLDHDHVGCIDVERKALLKFKQRVTDPSGRLSSWDVGEDCCQWRGIRCNHATGRVVEIKLGNPQPENALSGEVNSALLALKDLNHLDLSMNNFNGYPIPYFIGSLEKLRYLNLSGASFGGTIPPSLGNLSRLNYLDLKNVDFLSEESDLNWLSGLSSLKYLDLGGWNLSKAATNWFQTVNMLPQLLELHLSGCDLSNVPFTLPFINFTSLSVLDLSNNGFKTKIPHWLFNLRSLTHLDLNSNNFQGALPEAIANLASLLKLDLSENNIGGQLPRNMGKLCTLRSLKLFGNQFIGEITDFTNNFSRCSNNSMETLDLGYNGFTGNLPDSLGFFESLKYLQLWQNSFQGLIPESIGNLSSIEELCLSYNQMSGGISKSLGQLKTLRVLEMSGNNWEGVITKDHLVNLSSLEEVKIYKHSPNISLVFDISSNWVPPFKLTYIDIRSCQLGPKFPQWLKNQSHLTIVILNNARISEAIPNWFWQLNLELNKLDVSYNQISGRVPNSLRFSDFSTVDLRSNCYEGPLPLWSPNVTRLYLNDNHFSGPIPPNIGEVMPFLTDLDISGNSLSGRIPLSIGKLTNLYTLVISNNQLTGEIPSFWDNMPFLYIVDMSNNSLSGTIPRSMGSLQFIEFFILSKNNLSGELPSLKNCTNMVSLDLGENKLSSNLLTWMGESTASLMILRLRSNFFTGGIPPQLCGLSNLHLLDLSHNNLSGHIPHCIGNLSGLKSRLTEADTAQYQGRLEIVAKGRVLRYDSTLYLVNSFDLSDNNLSGEIPTELTSLIQLGTLNLSMNHLTGTIPPKIGNLERLETLDLSMNKLSGPIPQNMSSLTFLNYLNLSYNDLSGKIPTTTQFQTLGDPSIYQGNAGLCGDPLPKKCDGSDQKSDSPGEHEEDKDGGDGGAVEKPGLIISVAIGFFVGFWGVCGTLIVKQSWREAYFGFVERVKNIVVVPFMFVKERAPWNY